MSESMGLTLWVSKYGIPSSSLSFKLGVAKCKYPAL